MLDKKKTSTLQFTFVELLNALMSFTRLGLIWTKHQFYFWFHQFERLAGMNIIVISDLIFRLNKSLQYWSTFFILLLDTALKSFQAVADVNAKDSYGRTVFHRLASDNESKLLEHIWNLPGVEYDINIQKEDSLKTPLHVAVRKGHFQIVKTLFDHAEDLFILAKDKDGLTPLAMAKRRRRVEIVKYIEEIINS